MFLLLLLSFGLLVSSNFGALVTEDSLVYSVGVLMSGASLSLPSVSILTLNGFLPSLSVGALAPEGVPPSPFVSVLTPECSLFSSVSVLLLGSAVSRLCSGKLLY